MSYKIKFIALALSLIFLFSGCSLNEASKIEKEEKTEKETEVIEVDPEKLEIEEFFKNYVTTDGRPIAVMVDNDNKDARPHAGLNEAYLIYEMIIEGGSTRFMALFRNADTEKIGPVRSSRHYFLDYVMENDAIYTHFGWSPKAMQDISSFRINKINGILGSDEDIFWREKKYRGDWHSAYTSIENIRGLADKKGYKNKTEHKNSIQYKDEYKALESENIANNVELKYSYKYTTGYIYNKEKKVYEKTIDNEKHVMQSGEVLEVKNIIIQLISDVSLGDGSDRRNINTTGSGKGYYITDGKMCEITWSKASRKENTIFKNIDGEELLINPGKTIVNIISPSAKISFS